MGYSSLHISISINCPADQVYEFIRSPENLPQWATGLSGSIVNEGGLWIAQSPLGEIKISFVAQNHFGIVDHEVTLPSGEVVYNPMRVLENGDGSEVVFTLFKRPGMTDEMMAADAAVVKGDLGRLKRILEK